MDFEHRIADLKSKIEVEKKCKQGAEYMLSRLKEQEAIDSCEHNITETTRRLNFLQSEMYELQKMRLEANGTEIEQEYLPKPAAPKSEVKKITRRKTSNMGGLLQRFTLKSRSHSATNLNEVFEGDPGVPPISRFGYIRSDTSITREKVKIMYAETQHRLEVEQRVKEGTDKMLHARAEVDSTNSKIIEDLKSKSQECMGKIFILQRSLLAYQSLNIFDEIDNSPNIKRPNSGKLTITVLSAVGLTGKKFSKSDLFVTVSVDNSTKSKTRNSRGTWNETLFMSFEKGHEVEIAVHEQGSGILGLVWFKIYDLLEDNKMTLPEGENTSDVWLNLLPGGKIHLQLTFGALFLILVPEKPKKKGNEELIRQRAVQKFTNRRGHKFIGISSYQVLKCAICHEFLVSGQGLNCQTCDFICHRKCVDNVVSKCIAKSDLDKDENELEVKHKIPHRFSMYASRAVNWCCHCGKMLPLGKNTYLKCTECSLSCHEGCKIYIPELCGLPLKLMSELRSFQKAGPTDLSASTTSLQGSQDLVSGEKKNGLPSLQSFQSKKEMNRLSTVPDHNQVKQMNKNLSKNERQESLMFFRHGSKGVGLDDFTFLAVLGKGNFGKVMLAQEKFTNNYYGIKVLKKEFILEHDEVESDLKLDNILLTLDGHVKIADYGLCKENMAYGSATNTFCGTPEFMAPEILAEKPYGRAVDWWSFGVLIYEMVLGKAPFSGDSEERIFQAILRNPPMFPDSLDKMTVDIIQRLLNKDASKRLGGGPTDADEIKTHPYFKGINWNDVYNLKIPPPYLPKITSPTDLSNFDEEFTSEVPVLTPVHSVLSNANQEEFRGFTFVSDWAKASRAAVMTLHQ
ncbi:Serine/threonine kinase [Boothiomyces macroporosus]|uniref:protein kinase C n=1 Tax=Boothiomyces macroporosus TaxID=261099 RepID=A0AAD5Y5W9_9FUNG|nr:Serine/threonine kinase [Boothiomyces macroporosus]